MPLSRGILRRQRAGKLKGRQPGDSPLAEVRALIADFSSKFPSIRISKNT